MLSAIFKKQFAGEEQLPPYNYHVRDTIVSLEDGRMAFILKAKGLPFEMTSDNVLENQYDELNGLFSELGQVNRLTFSGVGAHRPLRKDA